MGGGRRGGGEEESRDKVDEISRMAMYWVCLPRAPVIHFNTTKYHQSYMFRQTFPSHRKHIDNI